MRKTGTFLIILLYSVSSYCQSPDIIQPKTYLVIPKGIPRNIIVIMANGMGMNQVAAATLKKGAPLSFSDFPVTGFTQSWLPNGSAPTDSSSAIALSTNIDQKQDSKLPMPKTVRLLELAKEKKMLTGLIVTGPVTGTTAKILMLDNYLKKDNETLAEDYANTDLNILMGGGSKYFNLRYDGKNLLNEFKSKGYKIENKLSGISNIGTSKAIALIEKDGLYRASERNDFLTKATINSIRAMSYQDGFFIVVDDTKIEEADSLNNTKLMDEEILDLDRLVNQIKMQSAAETLVLVIGNYESGGLMLKNTKISSKTEPDVTWTSKSSTAALAPVFATGPGSEQFSGVYSQADLYAKLADLMTRRR